MMDILTLFVAVFALLVAMKNKRRLDLVEANSLQPIRDMIVSGEGWVKTKPNTYIAYGACGGMYEEDLRDGPAGVKVYGGEPIPE